MSLFKPAVLSCGMVGYSMLLRPLVQSHVPGQTDQLIREKTGDQSPDAHLNSSMGD